MQSAASLSRQGSFSGTTGLYVENNRDAVAVLKGHSGGVTQVDGLRVAGGASPSVQGKGSSLVRGTPHPADSPRGAASPRLRSPPPPPPAVPMTAVPMTNATAPKLISAPPPGFLFSRCAFRTMGSTSSPPRAATATFSAGTCASLPRVPCLLRASCRRDSSAGAPADARAARTVRASPSDPSAQPRPLTRHRDVLPLESSSLHRRNPQSSLASLP